MTPRIHNMRLTVSVAVDESQFGRYCEAEEPTLMETDIITSFFDFEGYDLIETDCYYEWNCTYEFDSMPTKLDIDNLMTLVQVASANINTMIEDYSHD